MLLHLPLSVCARGSWRWPYLPWLQTLAMSTQRASSPGETQLVRGGGWKGEG